MRAAALGILTTAVLLAAAAPSASAQGPEDSGPQADITATAAHAGEASTATIVLTDGGAPVPGVELRVQRRKDGPWTEVRRVTTGEDGVATTTLTVGRRAEVNTVRVVLVGEDGVAQVVGGPVTLPLLARTGVGGSRLRGPSWTGTSSR